MPLWSSALSSNIFTACCRNNLHAAWRVGQTQKYDKMALQQAELQAAQRQGPVTVRQQHMQEKAAARRNDTLRGLSKDYALLDALKQVRTRGPGKGGRHKSVWRWGVLHETPV